jgi:hypothetical protein
MSEYLRSWYEKTKHCLDCSEEQSGGRCSDPELCSGCKKRFYARFWLVFAIIIAAIALLIYVGVKYSPSRYAAKIIFLPPLPVCFPTPTPPIINSTTYVYYRAPQHASAPTSARPDLLWVQSLRARVPDS